MNEELDGLLSQYERGHLTRRQFLTASSVLLAASSAFAAPAPIGKIEQLNHVTVFGSGREKVRPVLSRRVRHDGPVGSSARREFVRGHGISRNLSVAARRRRVVQPRLLRHEEF